MMINTVESLRGLYVALGGNISEVANLTTIPELLTEISTVAQAAATELPAVKPADNGKVLTVVNSKWAKADLPTAASDKLGGIKVGSGLAIADGVLSASGGLPAVTTSDSGKFLVVNNSGEFALSDYVDNFQYFTVTGAGAGANPTLPTAYDTYSKFLGFISKNPNKTFARVKGLTDFGTNDYIDVALSSYSGALKSAVFSGYFAYVKNFITTWKKIEVLLDWSNSYFSTNVIVGDYTPST